MKRIVRMAILGLMIIISTSVSAQSNELRRYIADLNKSLPVKLNDYQSVLKYEYLDSVVYVTYYLYKPFKAMAYHHLSQRQKKAILTLSLSQSGDEFINLLIRNKAGYGLAYADSVHTVYFFLSNVEVERMYNVSKMGSLSVVFNDEFGNLVEALNANYIVEKPVFENSIFFPAFVLLDKKNNKIKFDYIVRDEDQFKKYYPDEKLKDYIAIVLKSSALDRLLLSKCISYGYKISYRFYRDGKGKVAETLKMIKSVDLKETELRSIQNDIY